MLPAQPDRKRRQDVQAITLALFSERERFRCDRSVPERWSLTASNRAAVEVASQVTSGRPAAFDRSRSYAWQRDALACWAAAQHCGVVEAVTGSGKTMLGVAAAVGELARRGQVLVIVPTVELMHQWHRHMTALLPPGYLIGCLGDGETGVFADLRHHRRCGEQPSGQRPADDSPRQGLLVADECHRYASAMNRLALDQRFERRLGLSATYARDDDGHVNWLDPFFGGTCFRMGYRRAVDDGVTAHFSVALVGVSLPAAERAIYEEPHFADRAAARSADAALSTADCLFWPVHSGAEPARLRCRQRRGRRGEARAYLALLLERRRLLGGTPAKTRTLAGLAPAIASADRSIVFTGSIATAETAVLTLTTLGLRAECVHSRLATADRREVLRRFAEGDLQVISAPRVLDEGVDVPEADLAVIIGASRSRRQMIQRMGPRALEETRPPPRAFSPFSTLNRRSRTRPKAPRRRFWKRSQRWLTRCARSVARRKVRRRNRVSSSACQLALATRN